MNFLYVASDPRMRFEDPTGYGSHIRKTVAALKQEGHQVLSLVGGDVRDISRLKETYGKIRRYTPSFLKELQKVARDIHEITDDRRSLSLYLKKSDRFHTQVIYERAAPFRRMGQRLSRILGCPLILEINDPISETLSYYPSPLKNYATSVEKIAIDHAKGVVVGSEALREYYVGKGFQAEKFLVIYPTADYSLFDPTRFKRATQSSTSKSVSIGFIGNMRAWHRVDLLLEAFRQVCREANSVRLDLVGDGPEMKNIRDLAFGLGIEDKVNFHGSVPYEKIPYLIAGFDICAIPNATWYGSPTKLFEYAAMGKAIVGNRQSPVAEIIRHEENGLLFDALDSSSLANALLLLVEKIEFRENLGEKIRTEITTEITWEKNIKKILEISRGIPAMKESGKL